MAWPPRISPTALTPFAVALRRLRKQQNWTQGELGRKSGIGQSTLSAWERDEGNGRKPDLGELVKLARAFKLTPEALGRLILPREGQDDPRTPPDQVEVIERRNPKTGARHVALTHWYKQADPLCEACMGLDMTCFCVGLREEVITLPLWASAERLRQAADLVEVPPDPTR